MFAFTLREEPTEDVVAGFINRLRLFGIGFSWGGFKSLVTVGKYDRPFESDYTGKTMVRLNIRLENADDLIQDIEKSMKQMIGKF